MTNLEAVLGRMTPSDYTENSGRVYWPDATESIRSHVAAVSMDYSELDAHQLESLWATFSCERYAAGFLEMGPDYIPYFRSWLLEDAGPM